MNHYQKTIITVLFIFEGFFSLSAQVNNSKFQQYRQKIQDKYEKYKSDTYKKFEEYRRKRNMEFAEYVELHWQAYHTIPGKPQPKEPKPIVPVFVPKDIPDTPRPPVRIPQGDIKPLILPPDPRPLDLPTMPKEDQNERLRVDVSFFGTPVRASVASSLRFSVQGTTERDVADAFRLLSGDKYAQLVSDCIDVCERLNLNGWASFKLCEKLAEQLEGKSNESKILQVYLLAQLGYDVRLGRLGSDGRLCVLCPFEMPTYTYLHLMQDGVTYYVLDKDCQNNMSICTYPKNLQGANKKIGFENPVQMQLAHAPTPLRTLKTPRFPDLTVQVSVNRNLIDYYATQPYFANYSWPYYARQDMENHLAEQLLPPLRRAVQGKNERDAVFLLLNFMQFAFDYATDGNQFGYEKPFFFEENIFYPKNDCEDRAILFSYLVRTLVGLDTVLLYAPGHLWAAVHFNDEVGGDYVMMDGRKYVVCDPTYIGAGIGMTQPAYTDKHPIVLPVR